MDCFDGVLFPVELCLFLKGMELQQVATGVLGGVPLGVGVESNGVRTRGTPPPSLLLCGSGSFDFEPAALRSG